MSAHTKKHLTKKISVVIHGKEDKEFEVPAEKARALILLLNEFAVDKAEERVPADALFSELDEKFTRAGAALQGARLKAEMSQVELSKKLGIDQGDLSKMENGKRTIGKKMAQRLAKILNVDYRIFL